MSCSPCSAESFRKVYAERSLAGSALLEQALRALPPLPFAWVTDRREISASDLNGGTLFLCRPRGRTVSRCPGSRGQVCCNYLTVDLFLGCTIGCSYCSMRSYLNFGPLTVYLDPEPAIARLGSIAERNAPALVRVGTGEVGDSLLLDPVFRLSERFIRALAPYPNVAFELKTKTHHVQHLLPVQPKGSAVIGFSLNPPALIEAYEPGASSLEQRLEAARQAALAGYRVSFHFDPIVLTPDGQQEYLELAGRLQALPRERIAWISLGTLRYPPELKRELGEQPFLYQEFVRCPDGKFRYPQKLRQEIYRRLASELRRRLAAPVYLCMESAAVWRHVFGALPDRIPSLRAIFRASIGA
jgi:spore photoproduct lyase